MKSIFTSFVFIVLMQSTFAQITLDSANNGYAPGVWKSQWNVDTTGFYAGSAGLGQVWDFSNIQPDSLNPLIVYVDSAGIGEPWTSTYPEFNIIPYGYVSTGYFYRQRADGIAMVGLYQGTAATTFHYSDPAYILHFPLAFGDSLYDDFNGTSPAYTHSGHITVQADGEGTLILPWGSYPALRVKYSEHSETMPNTGGTYTDAVNYSWYTATERYPILEFSYGYAFLNGVYQGAQKKLYLSANVVGINEKGKSDLSVNTFPNPVSDFLTINYILSKKSNVRIIISDLLGRTVQIINKGNQAGMQSEVISLGSLPKGVYIVNVQCDEMCGYKKIVKE
jgi:hypothetical protein